MIDQSRSGSRLLVLELLYTAILCFVGCCCLVLKRNNGKAWPALGLKTMPFWVQKLLESTSKGPKRPFLKAVEVRRRVSPSPWRWGSSMWQAGCVGAAKWLQRHSRRGHFAWQKPMNSDM